MSRFDGTTDCPLYRLFETKYRFYFKHPPGAFIYNELNVALRVGNRFARDDSDCDPDYDTDKRYSTKREIDLPLDWGETIADSGDANIRGNQISVAVAARNKLIRDIYLKDFELG